MTYRWEIIRMFHDLLGHGGIEHTHRLMAVQIYWPGMKKDVAGYCMACTVCQQRKVILYEQDTMENTEIHGALKHIHVDLAGPFRADRNSVPDLEKVQEALAVQINAASRKLGRPKAAPPAGKKKGKMSPVSTSSKPVVAQPPPHWILLIVDYFTKAAEFVAVPSKSSALIAHALYDNWFCRYGTPTFVTSDNGTEFQGQFAAMLERLSITHVTTAVRHPQANGACERLVQTIKRKLYSYCDGHPTHWISYLPRLRYAYMQEVHAATGISPFELVYGFAPNHPLPVSLSMSTPLVLSIPDRTYLDHVMHGDIQDDDLCRHVEQLRQKHMLLDGQVKDMLMDAQNREIDRFYRRKAAFHNRLPVIQEGDFVFEVKESPKPMQAVADGPYQVVSRSKDQVKLRTATTKWDQRTKFFNRRADSLAPCLTRRQAVARAHGYITPSHREASFKCLPLNALLEFSFE